MQDRTFVLRGDSVALVEMTEADQPMFRAWLLDPELREQIDNLSLPSPEDQMNWFRRVREPDRRFFSLVTLPEATLIGNAGFVEIDGSKNEATLRITIGNPDARGKGYGSEAVLLLLRYAFTVAGWKRVLLRVLSTNARAIRTYEKAGFALVSKDVQDTKTVLTMEKTA